MAQTYSFRIQAEGLEQFRAQMAAAVKDNEALAAAWQRLLLASPQLASAMDRAQAATDRATTQLSRQAQAANQAAQTHARFGQVVAAAGPQLQDLVIQLQMGTNAFTAIAQQGSQFLGMFGAGGAMAGVALAIGAVVAQMVSLEDATKRVEEANRLWVQGTEALTSLLETQAERVARLRREQADLVVQSRRAVQEQAQVAIEQASRNLMLLEEQLTRAQQQRAQMSGGGLAARALDRTIAEYERRIAVLRADLETQSRVVREMQSDIDRARAAVNEPSGPFARDPLMEDVAAQYYREQRQRQEREAEQAAIRAQKELNELLRERQTLIQQNETAYERYQRRMERLADLVQRAEQAGRPIPIETIQREAQRALEELENAENEWRERRLKEEQRYWERVQRQADSTTDSIVRYGADRFADLFDKNKDGWQGMLDVFWRTFKSLMGRIAAEAIIRPIVAPIVNSFYGSGGLATTAATITSDGRIIAGSNGPGLMGYASQASSLYGLGSRFGLFGADGYSLASLGNVFTPGAQVGTGIGFLDSALNAPLSSMSVSAGESAFRGAAGLSAQPSFTVGNALGSAASIAGGAYGLYSGLNRGGIGGYTQALGGAIGATSGAISAGVGAGLISASSALASIPVYGWIAAAVLSIIGALLPGAKPSNKTGSATIGLGDGSIYVFGQEGAKFSQENRDAARSIAQSIYSISQNLEQLLGQRIYGAVTVDVGNRDGIAARFNDGPTRHYSRDQDGQRGMARDIVLDIVRSLDLPGVMRAALDRVDYSNIESTMEGLAKVAAATNGGRLSEAQIAAGSFLNWESLDTALADLTWIKDVYDTLSQATEPVAVYTQQIEALNAQYEAAIQQAQRLHLGTDALVEAWRRAGEELAQQRQQAISIALGNLDARLARARGDGLTADLIVFDLQAQQERTAWEVQLRDWALTAEDTAAQIARLEEVHAAERLAIQQRYNEQSLALEQQRTQAARSLLEQMTIGELGGLSPEARYFAAMQSLNAARRALEMGEAGALAEYTRVAQMVLPVARDFLGTSERFAAFSADVASTLTRYAPDADTAGLARWFEAQARGTDQIAEMLQLTREEHGFLLKELIGVMRRVASQNEAILRRAA